MRNIKIFLQYNGHVDSHTYMSHTTSQTEKKLVPNFCVSAIFSCQIVDDKIIKLGSVKYRD